MDLGTLTFAVAALAALILTVALILGMAGGLLHAVRPRDRERERDGQASR